MSTEEEEVVLISREELEEKYRDCSDEEPTKYPSFTLGDTNSIKHAWTKVKPGCNYKDFRVSMGLPRDAPKDKKKAKEIKEAEHKVMMEDPDYAKVDAAYKIDQKKNRIERAYLAEAFPKATAAYKYNIKQKRAQKKREREEKKLAEAAHTDDQETVKRTRTIPNAELVLELMEFQEFTTQGVMKLVRACMGRKDEVVEVDAE